MGEQQEPFEVVEAPQETTESLVQELRSLKPSEELLSCLQRVVEDYQNLNDGNLKRLMKAMIKEIKEHQAKGTRLNLTNGMWSLSPRSGWFNKASSSSWYKFTPSVPSYLKSVKVFSVVTGKTFGADKEILKKVNMKECGKVSDCDVVVVFCPVTSRVGSDVDDAMRNLPGGANEKKLILVVMHHLREADSQTNVRLNCPNVSKEVHVLFHQTKKGLIQCGRNDQAVQELRDFLL